MIFPEVKISQPDSFEDFRGELYTLFKQTNNDLIFNHDKVSVSRKNVLRGLHGDSKSWKLITCLAGEVMLVVVDNRKAEKRILRYVSMSGQEIDPTSTTGLVLGILEDGTTVKVYL